VNREPSRAEVDLPIIDGLLLCGLLDEVVAGNDVSSWADEADLIVGGLKQRLSEVVGNHQLEL